jgi:hypothetical protein
METIGAWGTWTTARTDVATLATAVITTETTLAILWLATDDIYHWDDYRRTAGLVVEEMCDVVLDLGLESI